MPHLRHISIVTIAVVCSSIVLAFLMFITGTVTAFSRTPAEFLPAENTIAVFHNADTDLLDTYTVWFPELENVFIDGPTTIAIVALEKNKTAVISFTKQDAVSTPLEYWPYAVRTTSEEAKQLLQRRLQPLMKESGYRDFSRFKKPDDTWVFVRPKVVPSSASVFSNAVQAFITQNATAMAIERHTNQVTIELYKPSSTLQEVDAPTYIGATNAFTASFSNAKDALTNAWHVLPVEHQLTLTSLLQEYVQKNFGKQISGTYDLLPLLQEQTYTSIGYSASGQIVAQLTGTLSNEAFIQRTTERLQASRDSIRPTSELLEMQLDKQFRMRSLRISDNKNNDSVHIHHQDNTFTITNSENEATTGIDIFAAPTLMTSTTRSIGEMQFSALKKALLQYFTNEEMQIDMPIFPTDTQSVQWIWEERGNLAVLRLLFSEQN